MKKTNDRVCLTALTLKDIGDAIDAARISGTRRGGADTILFNGARQYGFIELDYALTRRALDEIARKVPFVEAGLDRFTAAEITLFAMFRFHALYQQDAVYGAAVAPAGHPAGRPAGHKAKRRKVATERGGSSSCATTTVTTTSGCAGASPMY